ncbi:hypothetical protein PAECIP111892_03933 [Paenibacillus auburnensis]|uniref:SMI1/KNR4 family protein n=1 Tax=Paenibacillus auburnensis TaxID=2905649 RepID=A0ABN8GNL1_9BACL|nr:hypothetical protein [Paenibacillus auburnensis]CAH1213931.1 hypothetical protein PAECIP111892_03933 [Paenibacillus auburnensis]
MLKKLFNEFIEYSGGLRTDYPESLGKATENWTKAFDELAEIPELFEVVYSSVQGTKRDMKDQRLMDFIPGYRLIHIEELAQEKNNLDILGSWPKDSTVLPLLVNYSSDYFCYVENFKCNSGICLFMHDEGVLNLVYRSAEKFLNTVIELYKQHIYYLDDDGYLDYDFQKEGTIGHSLNPDVDYWNN